jgi:hypothetical protein
MYKTPHPEEIRDFMKRHELTGSSFGTLCGVNGRTVRRWVAPVELEAHWDMPSAAWALARILCGESTPQEILDELNSE